MTDTLTLTPSTSYPLFSPDQVLSNRDLNHLVAYLESHHRLNRNHFMGVGIAFGLDPNATYESEKATITISPGAGITSEGYVISLSQAVSLTHYQSPQKIAASRFQVNSETALGEGNSAAEVTAASSTMNGGVAAVAPDSTVSLAEVPVLYTVTELFEGAGENPNRQPLHRIVNPQSEEAFRQLLAEHILIILCEQKDTPRDNYLLACDDLGRDRNFVLRYFLLPKNNIETDPATYLSAEQLLQTGYAPDTLPEPWQSLSVPEIFRLRQSFFQRHRIQVPRFGVDTAASDAPSNDASDADISFRIENYTAFIEYYHTLCKQTIEQIAQVLPHTVEIFSPFFSSFQPSSDDLAEVGERLTAKLQTIKTSTPSEPANPPDWEASYTIQYFYDYLVQIVAAYDELVHSAFDLMADSLPDIRRFPKFLMLGQVPTQTSGESANDEALPLSNNADAPYRSHFVQPPLYNQNHQRRRAVRHLYERLVRLCAADGFVPLPFYAAPLRITPGRDRLAPLSQQAIPSYLNYAKLYQTWNYDAARKGISADQPAYFLPKSASDGTRSDLPTAREDLHHRLDAYNFYRIEGHLGKDKATLLQQLRQYRQRWNLAFEVVTLKIDDNIDPDDGDAIDDINQARRLETIEQDFSGMKSLFQILWNIYEEDWSRNALLVTLKHVFFDRAKFSEISLNQLYNPVLAIARSDESRQGFTFQEILDDNPPTERYKLELLEADGNRLATVVFRKATGSSVVDTLNLSGFTGDALEAEKNRITDEISAALVTENVIYGVANSKDLNSEASEGAANEFFVTISLVDALILPIDPPVNQPGQVQVTIVSEASFTVDAGEDNFPFIEQPSFQNYETLFGLLRDIPDGYANERELFFQMGNRLVALDYIQAFHLPERIEAYRTSQGQIVSPQLFNTFAQHHPGMKHLGGVPEGGTFVLAYADDPVIAVDLRAVRSSSGYQRRVEDIEKETILPETDSQELEQVLQQFDDWTNIVVADYCLPYRVSDSSHKDGQSDLHCSNINLPPILLLEKTSFCADDDEVYEFLLYPPNGQLKGEGSFFANGKYRFQPTRVSPQFEHDVAIAFTYAVDGCESSLVVLVSPHPDPRFLIGKSNKTTFCTTDAAIALIPCFGRGTFTIDGEDDLSSSGEPIIQDNRLFHPARVTLDDGAKEKKITIHHRISNEQETCVGEISQTVTVYAQPAVDFQFGSEDDGEDSVFRVRADVATIELIGDPDNGVFRVLDGNRDISRRMLRGGRLLPSAFNLADAQEKPLQVEYSIVDEHGCISEITKALTIVAPPAAEFEVGSSGQTVFFVDESPISLIPETPGGQFSAFDGSEEITADVLELEQSQFIPGGVDLGTAAKKTIRLCHEITQRGFTNDAKQTVIVRKRPDEPDDSEENPGGDSDNTPDPSDFDDTPDPSDPDDTLASPSDSDTPIPVPTPTPTPNDSDSPSPIESDTPAPAPENRDDALPLSGSDAPVPIPDDSDDSPSLSIDFDISIPDTINPELAVPLVEETPSGTSPTVQRDQALAAINRAFNLPDSPQTISPIVSTARSRHTPTIDLSNPNEESDRLRDLTPVLRPIAPAERPSFEPSFLSQIRYHLVRTLNVRSNPKVAWTAVAGAIATIIVLIWAGIASNRSESPTPTSVSPSNRIHRISQS